MATREVVVSSRSGLGQTIQTGRHVLQADEPVESGGQDTGPCPYELLLAALGTSTSITLHVYADHKAWKLDRVTVLLEHWKVQTNARDGAPVDEIKKVVFLVGDLSNAQRDRLLDVAVKCPVHRTLAKSVRICTLLGTEAGA